jgi:hypothetical protein
LPHNSALFNQIVAHKAANWVAIEVELDLHEFAKSAAVVIPLGFGAAEAFQHGGGQQEHGVDTGNYN